MTRDELKEKMERAVQRCWGTFGAPDGPGPANDEEIDTLAAALVSEIYELPKWQSAILLASVISGAPSGTDLHLRLGRALIRRIGLLALEEGA